MARVTMSYDFCCEPLWIENVLKSEKKIVTYTRADGDIHRIPA